MMYFAKGRFHVGNVSFALPDNCYLDPCPETEGTGVYIRSVENDHYAIMVAAEHDEGNYQESMQEFILQVSRNPIFADYTVNNLTGFSALYRSSHHQYFEVRFPAEDGGENIMDGEEDNVVVFTITAKTKPSIETIVQYPMVQQLLSSFCRDEE